MDEYQTRLSKLTASELVVEYEESLQEYEEAVNKHYLLEEGWDDEVLFLITCREIVEDVLDATKAKNMPAPDLEKLKELDSQLIVQAKEGWPYVFDFTRDDMPKSKWWWWLDQFFKK